MKIKKPFRSKLGLLCAMVVMAGGLALPLSVSGQSQWSYDFNHLELGPLDQRDGWSLTTSNTQARIHMTAPSGLYQGGHAIGLDGMANTYIGGRAGIPDFTGARSITADVYLGPDNGRIVRVFGISGAPFQNSYAGILFGTTGGNNFNIRGAGFLNGPGNIITSNTWGLPDTWYRLTFSWSEPDGSGNRDVVLYGYDLTNRTLIGDRGKILEATVTSSFFGPDPSNYIGFGVRVDGDGEGTAMVHSVGRGGHSTFPLAADLGGVRFISFLDRSFSAPVTVGTVAEGEPVYMDTADTVTMLPAELSGKVALKTVNDFSGQAHQFNGRSDFVRLDGTREEFQHFLRGEGKATFRVNFDVIPATGYAQSRSFFLSANGNIQADHVDFNVGVSQLGNWWVSLSSGAGGQNYVVLEMDIQPQPEAGVWYDVEVDLDAGTFSVNGDVLRTFTPVHTIPAGGSPVLWQNDFYFGFTPNTTRDFNGQMTEVKFEDGAGNVTGHWKLDEAEDYVVADLSGNGHDGTVSGRARPLEDLSPYLGFVVDRPTTVYVAFDQNATAPSWLQNHFTLSGMQVATTAGGFNLWERSVAAREEINLLFDNIARQASDNNYWVILDQDAEVITDWRDSAFLRTGAESTWRLDPHHWTVAANDGASFHTASMISTIDNFDPAEGFRMTSNIRVPRLQDNGDNATGFILLADPSDPSSGIRAEWLPRRDDGTSRLQLVNTSTGAVLDDAVWTGLAPTAVDNDAGPTDRTDEVLFEVGSSYFTGGPLLDEDFEGAASGWTSGTFNATPDQWEIGPPTSGPWGAVSGDNVAATRLDRGYDSESASWLRTPPLNLTSVPDALLVFQEYLDVDTSVIDGEVFHFVTITVRDAGTLDVIAEVARYSQDILSWQERQIDLSDYSGQEIVVEFALFNDNFMEFAGDGWYLDNVQVIEGVKRTIVSMPENLAVDGALYGLATDNADVANQSANYLQFNVTDRAAGGNDGLTVFVAWDSRAAGLEPDWLRDTFTRTDHFVDVSSGAGKHRLWAREYSNGDQVTLGGASATGAGPFISGTDNYFVLFGDARPGLETEYTLTAEGVLVEGEWTLSFSLNDNAGNVQTVSATTMDSFGGNIFGLFADHPGAPGGSVTNPPAWQIFDVSFQPFNAPVPAGFEAWREEHFAGQLDNPDISGPEASPAGDGVTNLMKYGLKLDPWVPASSADLPWLDASGSSLLVLVYWERTDIDDIEYIPEVSEDLVIWRSGEPHVTTVFGPPDPETNTREAEATGNVSPEADKAFGRLRVILKE